MAKHKQRRTLAPAAAVTAAGDSGSLPAWAIVGLALGLLLVLSGIGGMIVTRGRR